MARQPRVDYPGSYHHVMNRGANRQDVFFEDCDRLEFGRLLGEIHERFGISCLAYCLMDNHFHLVLHSPEGNLSSAMQRLGGVYTQHTNERMGRDGALFRGRFRSIPITTDAYLLCAVRYTHRNCLDLPGVTNVDDYRWSSHRAYLGFRDRPAWLQVDEVLGHFASADSYLAFVAGHSAFTSMDSATADDVRSVIQLAIATLDESEDDVSQHGLQRTVEHLLCAHGSSQPVLALAARLPPRGAPAQRSALYRAKARLREHPDLEMILSMVRDMVDPPQRAA